MTNLFKNTLANWFFLNNLYDNIMVILTSIDILSQDQIKWEEGSKAGRGIRNHYIYSSQVTLNSSFFKLSFPIKKNAIF